MWQHVIEACGVTLWHWLPVLTLLFRSCIALMQFIIVVPLFVRRVRRWTRKRRQCHTRQSIL